MPGPPPTRSTARRRRNKPTVPITKATSDEVVRGPALTGKHSAVGRRFYEALRRSGQSQFFEPSDWVAAELVVLSIDTFIKSPTAKLLAAIQSGMTGLLATEADRRRLHVELERAKPEPPAEGEDPRVAQLDEYRSRFAG